MQQKSSIQSPAEKLSFGISLLIVSTIFILVCYTWIKGDNNPPVLSVEADSQIRYAEQQYYVPFIAVNSGGKTAESVEIVAELQVDGEIEETGRQQLDFLSRQEERRGEFIFTQNPDRGQLTIRVASYKLP